MSKAQQHTVLKLPITTYSQQWHLMKPSIVVNTYHLVMIHSHLQLIATNALFTSINLTVDSFVRSSTIT